MNQMSEQQMAVHAPILGWILIALHLLTLMIAGLVFVVLMAVVPVVNDAQAASILPLVAIGVAGFLTLLALPGILAGVGLLARKRWGQILALIVALFGLLNFPIGTLIGVYAFFVLAQNAASTYFQ